MTITAEDFEAWRSNPVTRGVFAALRKTAEANKQAWVSRSWELGKAEPEVLTELRVRAQANMDMVELTFEQLEAALERETG